MPRRFKVVSVNRINNCCPIYATEAPFISHPDQTGHACTIQNQSYYKQWTIENTKRLHMLCDDVVQQISVQSALGLHSLFCRLMQSEWKPVQRKSQNVEKDERCQKKRVKITWCQFCVQWTVKNEAQSCWKKPRGGGGGRPICSLRRKCRFLAAANKISMRSQGTRERNKKGHASFQVYLFRTNTNLHALDIN